MIDFKISLLRKINTTLIFVLALVIGIFAPLIVLGSLGFHDIEGVLAVGILAATIIFGVVFARYIVKWGKHKIENKGTIPHLILLVFLLIILTGVTLPSLFTYGIH